LNILDRYISRLFLKTFSLSLLVLTIIFILAQLFNTFQKDLPSDQAFILLTFKIPEFILQLAPIGALIGSLVTLSFYNRTSELIAMWASGYSTRRIAVLMMILGGGIGIFTFLGNNFLVPRLEKARLHYYWVEVKKRPDYASQVRNDRIWYRSRNLIYTIKTFDEPNQTLLGVSLYHFSDIDTDFRLLQEIEAARAIYDEGDSKWILKSGSITVFDELTGYPLTKHFDERISEITEAPNDFAKENRAETMTLKEIKALIEKGKEAGLDVKKFETNYHSRISLSFASLLLALLAIPFSMGNRRNPSVGRDVAIAFFIVVFYWLVHSIGVTMGGEGRISPLIGAWIANVLFFLFGGILVLRIKIPT